MTQQLSLLEWAEQQTVEQHLNYPRDFKPRPYQLEGAVHLRSKKKAMIYDQPGLGKTLQAAMAWKTPTIVSCPGYLVDQWADFLEDQYPQWSIGRITGDLLRQARQDILDETHDVYIVNHEMWAGRREAFKEPKPDPKDWRAVERWKSRKARHKKTAKMVTFTWPEVRTLVLDESHHFRNREASQSKQAAHFADTCEYVFLLTATPQYKDVTNWWHQLHIMDSRRFTSYWNWERDYTYRTGYRESIIKILPRRVEQFQKDIATYAIGRTYDQVGLFLPDLVEHGIKVNWHPDIWKVYKMLQNDYKIRTGQGNQTLDIDPGALLHTLRMVTACPEKVDAVKRIIEDIPGDSPIIIFCWYRDTAELLAKEFKLSPSSVYIHGEFNQAERLERASDPSTRIKCVTMASASEGVDWSYADTVIFFEEDYTPGKNYQALSRVRRFSKEGKKRPVICYTIMMRNSVDEAVHEAVTERNGDVRRILRRALK